MGATPPHCSLPDIGKASLYNLSIALMDSSVLASLTTVST
jgi:hypothetical protein